MENKFKSYIKNSPTAVFVANKKGEYEYVNKAAADLLGYSIKELLGKSIPNILFKEDIASVTKDFAMLKKIGRIQRVYKLRKKNNNPVYTDLRAVKLPSGDLIAFCQNITKQIEVEKELLFKKILFETQKEASIDGILIVDEKGKAVSFNQRFVELWKIPKKILNTKSDKKMLDFVVSQLKYPKKFLDKVVYLYKHKKEKSRDEIEFKDGRIFDRYSTPLITDDGQYLGRIWYFRDVTEHKKIDRAKTEFVSLASHQLRSPLTGIKWFIDLLSSKKSGKLNERQEEYLKEIDNSNERLIDLVNALLNVSRIELGVFAIEPKLISFTKIADSVLELLAPEIKKKKLQVRKNYDKKLSNIKADPNLVRIIFQNLLSNAVKYTPRGGRISLTIKKQEPNVLIKISDTGYGIPKNQQPEVFNKLFRADNIREVEPDGTGLGLYIVKAVVEQPGGKIWLKSEKNRGTTFYVIFPLKGMKKKGGSRGLTPT